MTLPVGGGALILRNRLFRLWTFLTTAFRQEADPPFEESSFAFDKGDKTVHIMS